MDMIFVIIYVVNEPSLRINAHMLLFLFQTISSHKIKQLHIITQRGHPRARASLFVVYIIHLNHVYAG